MSQIKLNYQQKLEFLKSGFHQYAIINLDTNITGNQPDDFVNITLRLEEMGGGEGSSAWGFNKIQKYLNDNYNNVLFTPLSDFTQIYQYEFYKGIFYIKGKPFEDKIAIHILPKRYKASDKILMFKDEDADLDAALTKSGEHYNRNPNDIINLYYQSFDVDQNIIENRSPSKKPYPTFHKFSTSAIKKIYYKYEAGNWVQEQYPQNSIYGEYDFDISSWAKNLSNVQINAGYKYNTSSSLNDNCDNPYVAHYTGIKDETTPYLENKAVLMDANYDGIYTTTNNIQQMSYFIGPGNIPVLQFPETIDAQESFKEGFNNPHTENSDKIFHKTIKYFNDTLYTEEDGQFVIGDWEDPSGYLAP